MIFWKKNHQNKKKVSKKSLKFTKFLYMFQVGSQFNINRCSNFSIHMLSIAKLANGWSTPQQHHKTGKIKHQLEPIVKINQLIN